MALPAILDPVVNASKSQKSALGVLGLVVLVAGAYHFVLAPISARITALEVQRDGVQQELAQSRAAVADLERFRKETVEIERRLEATKERLPTTREIPPLYRTLYEAASQAGLSIALFQPKEPKVSDYYIEIPIAVVTEGSYHQLGKFFESIAGLPRVVTVGDLKLTGIPRPKQPVRADMTLATYVYRPVGAPPAPKAPAKPAPLPKADKPEPGEGSKAKS